MLGSLAWGSHGNKVLRKIFYAAFFTLAAIAVLYNGRKGRVFICLEEDPGGKPESHQRNALILFKRFVKTEAQKWC